MAGERVLVASPIPLAGGRVIVSPFQFYTDGAENLRIEGWNTASGARLQVTYRFAKLDGSFVVERRELALTADRVGASLVVPLGVGYLVNMSVLVIGAAPLIGQTFACIKLIRGLGAAAIVVGILLQGYVGAEQGLGWPGSPIADSLSGPGYIRAVTGTTPAVGVNVSETVPTGARWELLAFLAGLTTSAAVATRRPIFFADNGVSAYSGSWQSNTQAASTTASWVWQTGLPLETTFTGNSFGAGWISGLPLLAGHRLRTFVLNLQAGDQFAAPVFMVREWLEVNA